MDPPESGIRSDPGVNRVCDSGDVTLTVNGTIQRRGSDAVVDVLRSENVPRHRSYTR